MTHSRKDYLDGKCTHREYYAQFVNDRTRGVVAQSITMSQLLASTDEHLNDIPLGRWDALPHYVAGDMKAAGDWLSPAGWVCIAKEAAQQLIEEANVKARPRKAKPIVDKITAASILGVRNG